MVRAGRKAKPRPFDRPSGEDYRDGSGVFDTTLANGVPDDHCERLGILWATVDGSVTALNRHLPALGRLDSLNIGIALDMLAFDFTPNAQVGAPAQTVKTSDILSTPATSSFGSRRDSFDFCRASAVSPPSTWPPMSGPWTDRPHGRKSLRPLSPVSLSHMSITLKPYFFMMRNAWSSKRSWKGSRFFRSIS